MVMTTIRATQIAGEGSTETFSIEIIQPQQPALLALSNARLGVIQFEGVDMFDAVLAIRHRLEAEGLLLLCNGARIDAYPSSMSRQMSSGRKLYVHELGVPGHPSTVVDIFDEAPADRIGTIAQQDEYMVRWRNSIG
jgi:hypothetical protein